MYQYFQICNELEDQLNPYLMSPPVESIQHNMIALDSSNLPATAVGGVKKKRQRSSENQENEDGISTYESLKKIRHRDIERQRRQEMGNLYASLRSLLPPQYTKGKRSTSDHMHEAVNYIKDLQKNVFELRLRKEKLVNGPDSSNSSMENTNTSEISCCFHACSVRAILCVNGVEVSIRCSLEGRVYPLSKVLRKMIGEGFNVVSYSSIRANDAIFYTILSEVDDPSSINTIELQKKLMDVIMHE